MGSKVSKTDCRTLVGVAVGLIDSIIVQSRVLSPILSEIGKDELPEPVFEALKDLTSDSDVLQVLRSISSRHIITEEKAIAFDGIIEGLKKKKLII